MLPWRRFPSDRIFADTALWVGSVETDADGFAEVPLTMPESLTAWRVRVWSLASGARVGQADAEVTTRKDLMVRLQAPRFLVETDEAILSAVVRNELPAGQSIRVRLDVDPATGAIELLGSPEQTVTIEAGSEARIDWPVRAERETTATRVCYGYRDACERGRTGDRCFHFRRDAFAPSGACAWCGTSRVV